VFPYIKNCVFVTVSNQQKDSCWIVCLYKLIIKTLSMNTLKNKRTPVFLKDYYHYILNCAYTNVLVNITHHPKWSIIILQPSCALKHLLDDLIIKIHFVKQPICKTYNFHIHSNRFSHQIIPFAFVTFAYQTTNILIKPLQNGSFNTIISKIGTMDIYNIAWNEVVRF